VVPPDVEPLVLVVVPPDVEPLEVVVVVLPDVEPLVVPFGVELLVVPVDVDPLEVLGVVEPLEMLGVANDVAAGPDVAISVALVGSVPVLAPDPQPARTKVKTSPAKVNERTRLFLLSVPTLVQHVSSFPLHARVATAAPVTAGFIWARRMLVLCFPCSR
jgi:hypothetical protein